jgi:hypothetical protein
MSILESLKPHTNQKVMDLVASAGGDVQRWAVSRNGPVQYPASNPAYCYEWAFVETGVVVLNVWHDEMEERDGRVWCDLNPRAYSERVGDSHDLTPSVRGSVAKRALRMDRAIATAFSEKLPVRLIVGKGSRRDVSEADSKASRMSLRLLDPEPWAVELYNRATGETRLTRGFAPRYFDQYTTPEARLPNQREVSGKVWERDRKVRDAALRRAAGKCEFCKQRGFKMVGGGTYLETHHVIPLSEGGADSEANVAALCPNDHREAHHGERREEILRRLLSMLSGIYGR